MADAATQRPALVRAMLEPRFFPHSPRSVELRATHISWVFLAYELAYKVKKPVVFPFLDYGTRERRHEMCREEVRLDRRLAPEIYLGVAGIARDEDRLRLTTEDDPAAVEHAVEMRRVEEGRSLAALAARGELDPSSSRRSPTDSRASMLRHRWRLPGGAGWTP
jgi:aminoglycoside phosphotransferase family enzyme